MKILVISQHLFPIQTPRAHRTTELIKELARKGHEITVYAVLGEYDYSAFEKRHNIRVKNIKISFQKHAYNSDGNGKRHFVDKVMGRLFGKILEFPNIEFKYSIAKIIGKEKKYDLLISVADPHHIHWGCARAKIMHPKKFPSKWIADCGDPFMNNNLDREHFKRFEKQERLFSDLCDFITVPIEGAKEGYYEEFRKKIRVIPQGFNFNSIGKSDVSNKVVSFAYSGVFLSKMRDPYNFLKYLSEIKNDYRFYIFTPHLELVNEFKDVLKEKMIIKKMVPRNELLVFLKDMDFLLNLENVNSSTQTPSKLIDYSIVGRPILSINPENIDTSKINEFLNKDYLRKYVVDNLDQYHISNVAASFIELSNS